MDTVDDIIIDAFPRWILDVTDISLAFSGSSLHPVQAPSSSHPEKSGAVFKDRRYDISAEARRVGRIIKKAGELSKSDVEPVQTVMRADPKNIQIFSFRPNGIDPVIAKTVGILRVIPIMGKNACSRIKAIQSSRVRSQPNSSPAIFHDGLNAVVAEAVAV
jgi:hypothetical protein